ncbi:GTPase-associated system all-helical protein GASH [Leptospira alexanderi]|uniref:GTPase-associated system all-helical protein GASH n=1 Tax=Leptospira alexanderi TaxID=100053 RepID=UPI0009912956|nr:GTPase-associated system all-helical protein GASH [Leptospira alexanderi]
MIQDFLNYNLIPVTDDNIVEKLKKSSDDLVLEFRQNASKVKSFALVALDPDALTDNIEIAEAKEIILKNWSTFLNNSKDTPLTLIRAVILEALEIISKEDFFVPLIWLTIRNIQRFYNLKGKEKDLIYNFLQRLGEETEKQAVKKWTLPSKSNIEKLTITKPEVNNVKTDFLTLQKRMEDASGPNNSENKSNFESPNPRWPNEGQNWSLEFAPRAAKGIADVIDKVLKEQQTKVFTGIQNNIYEILVKMHDEIVERNRFLQIRTELLWWKEACYSVSFNQSYKNQQRGLLQIAIAYDYASFIPEIYPTSVDYFLKETYKNIVVEEDKNLKLSEILKLIEQFRPLLKNIFNEPNIQLGRISLLDYIVGLVWEKFTLKQFQRLVGISDSSEMTLAEFTIWLFHDLQSLKILVGNIHES